MKKVLTFSAIAVLAASVVQATTVNWGINTALTDFAGGTAYLVWNSTTSEVLSYDGDLNDQKSFSSAKITDTVVASAVIGDDGKVSGSANVGTADVDGTGGNKPFYIAVITKAGDSIAFTATGNVMVRDTSYTAAFNRAASAFPEGNTYKAVPEPTSVALLALGLAALGLKRKVA